MPRPSVEVTGAKELRRAIRRAEDDLSKSALKQAHRDAAEVVATEARYTVPVRSGTLAASIRAAGTQTKGVVRAGFAKVPHAGVIHFGWPGHNISPQPFLYEAADARVDDVLDVYNARIEEIARRIEQSTP